MRLIFSACVAGALAVGCAADSKAISGRPPAQSTQSVRPPEIFRFHFGVWANLHQVLVHESLLPKPGIDGPKSLAHHSVAPVADLSPSELSHWRDVLVYYDRRFTTRNTFTDEFMEAVRGLIACGNEPSLPASLNLAADWKTLLSRAEPVYRTHFWATHERSDRAYVEATRRLVTAHGAWFVKRLAALYETPWPRDPWTSKLLRPFHLSVRAR
jgi:hypothetical protein